MPGPSLAAVTIILAVAADSLPVNLAYIWHTGADQNHS
jgi:hypothetical protein